MKLRIRVKEVKYRLRGVPQERWKAAFLVNGRPVGNLTGFKADIENLVECLLDNHHWFEELRVDPPETEDARQNKS